jgi:glucokinase/N-acetylglucosamine kinase
MILGIDVGGTYTDVVGYDGKFHHLTTLKTAEAIHRLNEIIDEFKAKAIGIGAAVWIRGSEFVHAPNLPFIPEFRIEKPFIVENDANCFAYYASKSEGYRNLLGITVGTGIGGGIITDGKIYKGIGIAGELGHTYVGGKKVCRCGGRGHLETVFGGWALKEPEKVISSGEVYETENFRTFCISIANAIMILNPEAVAFGGRIGSRLDVKEVKKVVAEYIHPLFEPEFISIKDDLAVAKGACMLAMTSISKIH